MNRVVRNCACVRWRRSGGSKNDVRWIQWSLGPAGTCWRHLGGNQHRSELRFQRKEIDLDTGGRAPAAAESDSVVFPWATWWQGVGSNAWGRVYNLRLRFAALGPGAAYR